MRSGSFEVGLTDPLPTGRKPGPGSTCPAASVRPRGPTKTRSVLAAVQAQLRGEGRPHVVAGANAETISDSGRRRRPSSRRPSSHAVRIDIESLPTGDADAEARAEVEGDRPSRCRRRTASSPSAPGRRHPVGGELHAGEGGDRRRREVREGLADGHAARSGAVDDGDRVRSPMAKASPRTLEGEERRCAVGHGHLPGTDHRVARAQHLPTAAVADRDQERLVGHGGVAQHAGHGLGEADPPGGEGAERRASAGRVPRHGGAACRAAPAGSCPPDVLPKRGP